MIINKILKMLRLINISFQFILNYHCLQKQKKIQKNKIIYIQLLNFSILLQKNVFQPLFAVYVFNEGRPLYSILIFNILTFMNSLILVKVKLVNVAYLSSLLTARFIFICLLRIIHRILWTGSTTCIYS